MKPKDLEIPEWINKLRCDPNPHIASVGSALVEAYILGYRDGVHDIMAYNEPDEVLECQQKR